MQRNSILKLLTNSGSYSGRWPGPVKKKQKGPLSAKATHLRGEFLMLPQPLRSSLTLVLYTSRQHPHDDCNALDMYMPVGSQCAYTLTSVSISPSGSNSLKIEQRYIDQRQPCHLSSNSPKTEQIIKVH